MDRYTALVAALHAEIPGFRIIRKDQSSLHRAIHHALIVVTLGATAAQSLLGKTFRLTQHRATFLTAEFAPVVLATVHPSSLLRMPDPAAREEGRKLFLKDFQLVAKKLAKL